MKTITSRLLPYTISRMPSVSTQQYVWNHLSTVNTLTWPLNHTLGAGVAYQPVYGQLSGLAVCYMGYKNWMLVQIVSSKKHVCVKIGTLHHIMALFIRNIRQSLGAEI